jgi:hypothetical protein
MSQRPTGLVPETATVYPEEKKEADSLPAEVSVKVNHAGSAL